MDFLKKANHLLFFLLVVLLVMYHASTLLVPLTFGLFLAMLMVPFAGFLEKHKCNTLLASLISTVSLFILLGILSFVFIYQIILFADQLPGIRDEIQSGIASAQQQIAAASGLSLEELHNIIERQTSNLWTTIESRLAAFIGGVLYFTLRFLLVFIYVFLILFYREKFLNFMIELYESKKNKDNVRDALQKIGKVVHQYLWGRIQVMFLLALLYVVTFLIFGLPFAVLIALFGALLTIIPYIGPLISGLLPIALAFVYLEDLYLILFFAAIIVVIHLIESYVFEPLIVGRELELNALTVIIAIIVGGIMWGIAGMILFVPIFATLKIISNHHRDLQPLGSLLGR